jgi:DNA polymerase III gamma/tau subunit
MRRSLLAALLIASLAAAAGCAHPQNLAPKPGETTTTTRSNPTPRTSTSTSSAGGNQTQQVCEQALSASDEAEAELTDKLQEAQTAATAGNTAAALTAANQAKRIAEEWKSELEDLAGRPIDRDVRDTLRDGVDTIDELLTTPPQQLDPVQARRDVERFLDDLEDVCR